MDRHTSRECRLFAAADAALYEAKRGGRNRVITAGAGAGHPEPLPLSAGARR